MQTVPTTERLRALRELMRKEGVDLYIVPTEDSHQSEYIAPCDARREFITGFSGSAGTAVIALDDNKAALATDGRYFNQASKQLDSNWELLKQGLEDVPTWQEWTADRAVGGKRVGVDPTVITVGEARRLGEKIKKKGGKELVGIPNNLVDAVWGEKRPKRPQEKIKPLKLEFTGKPLSEKIEDLRKELEKKKSAGLVVSMLDEVAWLYNLRGNDIPYNPVFFSYAIVTPDSASLYVDSSKFDLDVVPHLNEKVKVRPYDAILDDVKLLGKNNAETSDAESSDKAPKRKYMISTKASWALSLQLGGESAVDELRSLVGDAKAIKNKTEVEGMKRCHIRDGAALTEYFAWLEETLSSGTKLDEVEAADKLLSMRQNKSNFVGLSFDTISSTGPNAAVIHYSPKRGSCATIDRNSVYLCDSGGQYFDGTTDTTRTLHFGASPSAMERKAYTLVLKGVIALATVIFPKGTTGFALDAFARQHLWAQGLDYRHGTGHGVGSYLNVHEGPIGIGTRPAYGEVGLSAGNVLSDEPGYYEDGKFGIRIENVIVCVEKETRERFGDKPWLGFETVTMVPYCRNLIDVALLSEKEKKWIDEYHERVRRTLQEESKDMGERTLKWLERETRPL